MTWILRPHHESSDVRTDHCGVRHLGFLCQLLLLLTPTFSSLCISFLLLIIASAPRQSFVVCMTWILRPHHVSSDVRTDHCGVRHLGSLCQLLLLITPTFSSLCISFLLLIITPRHGGAPQSFVVCMTWILRPHDVSSDVLTDHCGVRHLCH